MGWDLPCGDRIGARLPLAPHATNIDHLGGRDRFATAAALASVTFGDPSALDTVVVAIVP